MEHLDSLRLRQLSVWSISMNLSSKQGGENEKLIFKILKRGEKLKLDTECEADLVDGGLRYDLTVPLSRYYLKQCQ